nr:FecR domain-containing protein [uncultured Bacteroides sp.]
MKKKRERQGGDINKIIHDYLTGVLSSEDQQQLENWLESSLQNRQKFEALLKRKDLTRRYRQYARIDEERSWERLQKRNFSLRGFYRKNVMQYAAFFLLPIIGLFIVIKLYDAIQHNPDDSQEIYASMSRSNAMGKQKAALTLPNGKKINLDATFKQPVQKVETQPTTISGKQIEDKEESEESNNKLQTFPDSEYWLTLEDGTIVHLNYNTTLRYPIHFNSLDRTVYLEGEAYFQVASEKKRPFRVVTTSGVVTQYGTSFNVNTHTLARTEVVLVKGSISVTTNTGKEQMLKPGELAILREDLPQAEIRAVDVNMYTSWNTGRFVFEHTSLEKLMETVSSWYGVNVIFQSDDIRKMYFTGDIDRYESITPVLKAIQNTTGLEIEMTGKNIILRELTIK